MKTRLGLWIFSFVFMVVCGQVASAYSSETGLVPLLMDSLGVTKAQAMGGAGAIFTSAKSKLPAEDFSKVEAAVPGMDELLQSAPRVTGDSSMIQAGKSFLGGGTETLQGVIGLADSFSQLGLSPDMMSQFTPVILDYVQQNGGDAVRSLLQGALL